MLVLVLSLGFVSAHVAYYNMDGGALRQVPSEGGRVLSYEKFENVNRYPVESYRLGYAYRATDDYKKRYVDEKDWGRRFKKYEYWGRRDSWKKGYYYRFVSYLGEYERVECYHSAPRGKLLYRKCPSSY